MITLPALFHTLITYILMADNIDSLKMRIIEYVASANSEEELVEIEQHIRLNALCYEIEDDEEIIEEAVKSASFFNKILDDLERIELIRS